LLFITDFRAPAVPFASTSPSKYPNTVNDNTTLFSDSSTDFPLWYKTPLQMEK
jgi:hypothetical protein